MKDYVLSKEKIDELEKLHRSLRDKRQADRVKAVIALSRGWSAAQVAEILLFDEKTSRHYFDRYQQGGLTALLDDSYSGAEPKLDAHQMSELEGYLEEYILPEAKKETSLYGVPRFPQKMYRTPLILSSPIITLLFTCCYSE